jgi:predicted lipoprotein with Yx(FWY)xxD motif
MKGVKEMRNRKLLGILPVFILVLAACVPAPLDTTGTVAPTEPVATEPLTTETQMAETPTTGATTVAETPTTGIPVTGSATVNVSETADFGPVLVNDEDYSLYVFLNDTQNSGTSTCTGACAGAWPPLITDGPPVAGEGVDEFLLSTLPRDDGSTQVTYNGWPLYLFADDTAPGDTLGQGLDDSGGLWFLISPDGEPIQQ